GGTQATGCAVAQPAANPIETAACKNYAGKNVAMQPRKISCRCLFTAMLGAQTETRETDIAGDQSWGDTGVDLRAGDSLRLAATGTLRFSSSAPNGPEGQPRGWRDLVRALPVNDAGRGALLMRIGDRDTSRVFAIGAAREIGSTTAGRLFLGTNRPSGDSAAGSFHVTIAVTRGAPASAAPSSVAVPKVTQAILDQIPLRIGI